MFEEPTVDTQPMTEQSAADDALQAVSQEEDVGQSLSEALDQLMADDPATHEDDAPQPDKESEGDAGIDKGIKGRFKSYEAKGEKRGYEKGKAEAEAAWAKERQAYEERLSKLQNLELQDEAKKLAAEEKITEKLAMRILRAERGLAPQAETAKAERDAQGRFMAKPADEPARAEQPKPPDTHVKMLLRQAERIQKSTGVDVNALFQAAPADVKQKIALGEMDFEDLAATATQRRAPSPVRTPNTNTRGVEGISIRNMTDEQFEQLNKAIDRGYKFDARR